MYVFFKVSEVQEIVIFSIFLVEFGHCLLLRDDDVVLYVDEERGVVGTVHPTVDVLTEITDLCSCWKEKFVLVQFRQVGAVDLANHKWNFGGGSSSYFNALYLPLSLVRNHGFVPVRHLQRHARYTLERRYYYGESPTLYSLRNEFDPLPTWATWPHRH